MTVADTSFFDRLVRDHRIATIQELILAVPFSVIISSLRLVTFSPAALIHIILIVHGRLTENASRNPRSRIWPMMIAFVIAFPFLLMDELVSEHATRLRGLVLHRLLNFSGARAKRAFSDQRGFVVLLRDFRPSDSDEYNYIPFVGSVRVKGAHRDEYIFLNLGLPDIPIIAVDSPFSGPPSNNSVAYLRFRGSHWLTQVQELLTHSRSILVAMPLEGSLGRVLSSRSVVSARSALSDFFSSESERKCYGLAQELALIVADEHFRSKTLLANAFLDGNAYPTSSLHSLRSFTSLSEPEARQFLHSPSDA